MVGVVARVVDDRNCVRHNEVRGLDLRFAHSASRQGIANARAAYVIEHCGLPIHGADSGRFDEVVLFLGPDWRGVPLEVAAIEGPNGILLVIHAMPVRRSLLDSHRRVTQWHEL